jgi:hypothetical protein
VPAASAARRIDFIKRLLVIEVSPLGSYLQRSMNVAFTDTCANRGIRDHEFLCPIRNNWQFGRYHRYTNGQRRIVVQIGATPTLM